MTCPICRLKPKPALSTSTRRCAFHGQVEFTEDNWACGTMSTIRELVDACDHMKPYTQGLVSPIFRKLEHSAFALAVEEPVEEVPELLVVGWYKDRGTTSWAHIINMTNGEQRPLLYRDARRIVSRFFRALDSLSHISNYAAVLDGVRAATRIMEARADDYPLLLADALLEEVPNEKR